MSLGQRIRQARKSAGYSQRDLAKRVDVSAMAISKYERSIMGPSSDVLLRLADALGVRVEYFFRPVLVEVELRKYRKHPALSAKAESAVVARIEEWLERYLGAESLFPQRKPILRFKAPVSSLEEVEEAAQKLRTRWKLGLAPIENLMELLEEHGVAVGQVSGFEHFDACTFVDNGTPVIVVSRDVSGDRQRFSLAHELGHLVLESKAGLDDEKAAYRFAGAFLVPANVARQELGPKRSSLDFYELYLLKHKYGVSMQAWIYRAKELGIISRSMYGALFDEINERGWRRDEPGEPYPPERPTRMERIVMRALSEDMITRSRAQEILGAAPEGLGQDKVHGDRDAAPAIRG